MQEKEMLQVVELVDEQGVPAKFEHLMTLRHENKDYVVLLPMQPVEGVGEDEVMIMRLVSEGEEDTYLPIENPVLLEEVFQCFLDAVEEMEEDEAGEDDA